MVRTVKVRLELDREDFKQGLQDAAAEVRGFDGEVQGLGDSAAATGVEMKDAGDKARQLGDDAKTSAKDTETLGESMRKTGDETKKTSQSTIEFSDSAKRAGDGLDQLKAHLKETEAQYTSLKKQFVSTGNTSLLGDIKKSERDVQNLKSLVENTFDEAEQTGLQAGMNAAGTWIKGNPLIASAIAAGITLGGPLIASATLAIFGGGTLALGILGAVQDPRVAGAWKELGSEAKAGLADAANELDQPLIEAAGRLRTAWENSVLPALAKDFSALAPEVNDVADGLAGMVDNALPGFNALIAESGPMLSEIGADLPRMGDALSSFFTSVAAGGPGAIQFFHDLVTAGDDTLIVLGKFAEYGSKAYEILHKLNVNPFTDLLGGGLGGAVRNLIQLGTASDGAKGKLFQLKQAGDDAGSGLDRAAQAIDHVGLGATLAGDDFSKFSQRISATAQTTDVLAGQMADKLLNSMLKSDQAALSFHQALNGVTEAAKQNGHQIDINTTKGEANRAAVLQAVAANVQIYDAMIASGASAQDAAAAYDSNTGALVKQMRQAHFTQGQIDQLIGKYKGVPKNVDTNIAIYGLTQAIDGLQSLMERLNGLPDHRDITIEEIHRTTYVGSTAPSQYFKGLARGGTVSYADGGVDYRARSGILKPSDPGTILAGEPQTGGEVFVPRRGIPDSRGLALANVAAAWHGGRVVQDGPRGGAFGGGRVEVNSTLKLAGGSYHQPAELLLANWFHNAVLHGQITLKTDDAGIVRVA